MPGKRSKRSGVMLAKSLHNTGYRSWPLGWMVQPKLDGIRCRAEVSHSGDVVLYSSQSNPIRTVPHINEALSSWIRPGAYDGELMHRAGFQTLASIVKRKDISARCEQVSYIMFDTISCKQQHDRMKDLEREGQSIVNLTTLQILTTLWPQSLVEMESAVAIILAAGYEGVIFRHPSAYYETRKSSNLLKYKPTTTEKFKVRFVAEEISIHGDKKGRAGSLLCESPGGDFGVGSGLNDRMKDWFWRNQDKVCGIEIYVRYQCLTDSGIPLFPVFAGLVEEE